MSSPEPAMAPPRDAPDLLRRLLALIDTLHQPQDLELQRVTPFFRLPMDRLVDASPKSRALFAFGTLTNEWSFMLIWDVVDVTHLPGYGLQFYQTQGSAPRPPMTGICQLDAAQFHDALLKMGYRHVGSTRRASPARQYQRGLVEVEIGVVGESSESLEKISHDCIKRVSVDFLERSTDPEARQ